MLAVGDRPVVLAALVGASASGCRGTRSRAPAPAATSALFRERLRAAGLPAPWSRVVPLDADAAAPTACRFPCVVKPLVLSGSRGVIRADDPAALAAALARVGRILTSPDVRALRDPAAGLIQIEGFIAGLEVALEGVLDHGRLHVLAIFDKPDPLDGPFFEETLYVTPSPRGRRGARCG